MTNTALIRIINIVELTGKVLTNITSFIVFDESKVDTVIASAERHFRKLVREHEDVSEEVMLEFIEDGIAELSSGYKVLLYWSQTLTQEG